MRGALKGDASEPCSELEGDELSRRGEGGAWIGGHGGEVPLLPAGRESQALKGEALDDEGKGSCRHPMS